MLIRLYGPQVNKRRDGDSVIIGNIVKPGKLKSHKHSQCYWECCAEKNKITFVSYKSPIFTVVEMDDGLTFYPKATSPGCTPTTARQTLWALYELGYDYNEAHDIIDGLRSKHIVKA